MDDADRILIGDLRELRLLLTFERTLPDRRPISQDLLYQSRNHHAATINRAINRLLERINFLEIEKDARKMYSHSSVGRRVRYGLQNAMGWRDKGLGQWVHLKMA